MGVYFAKAQVGSLMGTLNDVSVDFFPELPQANEEVLFRIKSNLVNLTSADITWSVDGKKAKSGVGITTFSIRTKDVGVQTKINVTIFAVGGYAINKEIVIVPSSLDILWETVGSNVPPFYKGKALPTNMATIKYVAIPNVKNGSGTFVNPKEFVYRWEKDYELDIDSSGYGKNTYTVDMGIIDDSENVGVTSNLRGGGGSAQKYITTGVYDPKIVWYANSPLFGPQFERAINDGFTIKSSDVSIFAEPFFTSPKGLVDGNLSYNWQLNSEELGPQKTGNILTMHRNNNNQGTAEVKLTIENDAKRLQDLVSTLSLSLQ